MSSSFKAYINNDRAAKLAKKATLCYNARNSLLINHKNKMAKKTYFQKNKELIIGVVVLALVLVGVYFAGNGAYLEGRFGTKLSPFGPLGDPDLVIQDIYVDEDYKLTIVQANEGTSRAGTMNGRTKIYIDGSLDWTYTWSTLSDTSFLRAGGSAELQPEVMEGIHVVKACIDTADIVSESDETNNCLEVELGPDLVIDWLQHSPDPANDTDVITFGGMVWNDGNAPAPASLLAYWVGGSTYPDAKIDIPELQVGSSAGYEFEFEKGPLLPLSFLNTIIVDYEEVVDELDESNNEETYSFRVTASE